MTTAGYPYPDTVTPRVFLQPIYHQNNHEAPAALSPALSRLCGEEEILPAAIHCA